MTKGWARRSPTEVGETLLELLISVVLLGIATTAILGSMSSSIDASAIHEKQSTAGSILDNFAEYLQNEAVAPYVKCPSAPSTYNGYRNAFLTLLADSSSRVYEPKYLQGGSPRYTLSVDVVPGVIQPVGDDPGVRYNGNCASAETSGLQQLSLVVTSTDSKVDETTTIVKRSPAL
jgi:type II secretory pathway pseudopilin PulG